MSTNDGGAAFPTPYTTRDGDHFSTEYEGGMTLRDYFAAKAMPHYFGTGSPESRAKAAYAEADAMLAERAKP